MVNIGDFMMRLCNDIYKSTVHRVYNRATVERISMPFFFGRRISSVKSDAGCHLLTFGRTQFQLR